MSKPTCRELLTDLDITEYKVEELAARVERVLELHRADAGGYCIECGWNNSEPRELWPCPTVRLLDGEEP